MPEARRILPDGTEEEYRREKLLEQLPFDPVPQPLPGTTDVYYGPRIRRGTPSRRWHLHRFFCS